MRNNKQEKNIDRETKPDDDIDIKKEMTHKLYSNLMNQIEVLFGYNVLDSQLEDDSDIKSHIDQSTKLFKFALTTKKEDLGLSSEDIDNLIDKVSSNVYNQIFDD
ncbi:hypothetical protein SAMN05192588_2518 [Nonlabens sp. Hel1_33_55]|uniref:hypothetical protein n=1 Tax=Nonlabens sp. Hel1_33_55 TaxID=1336802 RepID=UPI000875E862|nr:hypothetical protein [Nonlabens sp. Hel1_33_55]SCY36826.1 hypothetical protein SAMN05192588_2518 [Nonlabens sp. Hel1_33_55]